MHKGKDLDCKVLSVMMRHLNILKYFSFRIESQFGPELFTFSWDFIDSDNRSDYAIQPPGKFIQYK